MNDAVVRAIRRHPAEIGRACGLTLLRDNPHDDWLRQMVFGTGDYTLLSHRGSYKTTCLCLAIALDMVLQPKGNIIFLRKTDGDAAEVVEMVKMLISTPIIREITREIYGAPVNVLKSDRFTCRTDCFFAPRAAPQLLGQGVYGSLTGKHSNLIFTDDIVNLDDRLSPPERHHTRQIYQELQNIRIPGGRILNCGTPWHPQDAISLMPNPHIFDCHSTGLLSEEEILNLRNVMSPELFAANYELRHISSSSQMFSRMPPTNGDPSLLMGGIAHVDAAYGGGDYTALTIGNITPGGDIILFGRLWQSHASLCVSEIVGECIAQGAAPIYAEVNGDKGYFARELRQQGISVRAYHEQMNKHVKISAYLRKHWHHIIFANGTDPQYIAQIMDYTDNATHDDAADSAACVCRVLEKRMD